MRFEEQVAQQFVRGRLTIEQLELDMEIAVRLEEGYLWPVPMPMSILPVSFKWDELRPDTVRLPSYLRGKDDRLLGIVALPSRPTIGAVD